LQQLLRGLNRCFKFDFKSHRFGRRYLCWSFNGCKNFNVIL